MAGQLHSIAFENITSQDQAWEWLEQTLPAMLLSEESPLRKSNYLTGYMQVRMQRVEDTTTCPSEEEDPDFQLPANVTCRSPVYTTETAATMDFDEIKTYWLDVSNKDGRSPVPEPWYFHEAGEHSELPGLIGYPGVDYVYDSSGYSMQYNLQYSPTDEVKSSFVNDMAVLHSEQWLNQSTRAVHVLFTTYNGNWDLWTSHRYTIEATAYGMVKPSLHVVTFRPTLAEYYIDFDMVIFDLIRLVLVLYVFIFQVIWDYRFERSKERSGIAHFRTAQGMSDIAIGICFFVAGGFRYGIYQTGYTVDYLVDQINGFTEAEALANDYHSHMNMEALLFALSTFRLFYFLRVNRNVYLIWTTIEKSSEVFFRLVGVWLPIVIGFVILSMTVNGAADEYFRSFGSAICSLIARLTGSKAAVNMNPNRFFEISFHVIFYFIVRLVFINAWLAIVIHTFQKVRISSGYVLSHHRWKEYNYVSWFLFGPLRNFYLNFLRPNIEKPSKASGDDD